MRLPFIQIIGANPIWYSTWLSRDPLHQPISSRPPLRCHSRPFPPPQSREADSKRICESFRYSSSFLLQFGIDRPYFRFSVGLPSSSSGILPHAKLSCSSRLAHTSVFRVTVQHIIESRHSVLTHYLFSQTGSPSRISAIV